MKIRHGFCLYGWKKTCLLMVFIVISVGSLLAIVCNGGMDGALADSAPTAQEVEIATAVAGKARIAEVPDASASTDKQYMTAVVYQVVLPMTSLNSGDFSYEWYIDNESITCANFSSSLNNYCKYTGTKYGEVSVDIFYKGTKVTNTNTKLTYTPNAARISYSFEGKDSSGFVGKDDDYKFIFLNNPEEIGADDLTDGITGKKLYETKLKTNTEFYFEHSRSGYASEVKFYYGIKLYNGNDSPITIRFNRAGASVCGDKCNVYAKTWQEYYRGDGMFEGYENGTYKWDGGLNNKSVVIESKGVRYIWLVRKDERIGNAVFFITDAEEASLVGVDNKEQDSAYKLISDTWAFDGVLNMTTTGGDANKVNFVVFAAEDGTLANFARGNNNQVGSLPLADFKHSQLSGEYNGLPEVKASIQYDIDNDTPAGTLKTYYSTTENESDLRLINGWVTNITGNRDTNNPTDNIAAYQREVIPLVLSSGLKNHLSYEYDDVRPFNDKVMTANYAVKYYDSVTINNNSDRVRTVAYFINTASNDTTLAAFVEKDMGGNVGDDFISYASTDPVANYTVNGNGITRINNARVSLTAPTFEIFSYRTNVKVWSAEIQPGGSVTIPVISLIGGMSYGTLMRRICIDGVCEDPTYAWGVSSGGTGGLTDRLGWEVDTQQVEQLTNGYTECVVNGNTIRSNMLFAFKRPNNHPEKDFMGWSLNGGSVLPLNQAFSCNAGETITIEPVWGSLTTGAESRVVNFNNGKYVVGINPGTKLEDLDLGLKDSLRKDVTRNVGVTRSTVTGDSVSLCNVDYPNIEATCREYGLVVAGDTTGDGALSVSDVARAYRHATNTNLMAGGNILAGDTDNDKDVDGSDVGSLYTSVRSLSNNSPTPISSNAKINSGSVSIDCDKTELKVDETTTCRLNGHSDYAITSLSVDVSKLSVALSTSNFEVNDSVWQGTVSNGRFILYTNQNVTGDFEIGFFVVTAGSVANNIEIVANNVSFDDASDYANYIAQNGSVMLASTNNDESGGDDNNGESGDDNNGENGEDTNTGDNDDDNNTSGDDNTGGDDNNGGEDTGDDNDSGDTGDNGNTTDDGDDNNAEDGDEEDDDSDDMVVPNTAAEDSQSGAPDTGFNTRNEDGAVVVKVLLPILVAGFITISYIVKRQKKHVTFGKR